MEACSGQAVTVPSRMLQISGSGQVAGERRQRDTRWMEYAFCLAKQRMLWANFDVVINYLSAGFFALLLKYEMVWPPNLCSQRSTVLSSSLAEFFWSRSSLTGYHSLLNSTRFKLRYRAADVEWTSPLPPTPFLNISAVNKAAQKWGTA